MNFSPVKRLALAIGIAGAVSLAGSLAPNAAQALTMTGSVSGTWDYAGGGFNVGDPFTATYSYDTTSLTPYSYSGTGTSYKGSYGNLLSLVVNSGSYSHTFDPSSTYVAFVNYAQGAPYTPYSYRQFYFTGSDHNFASGLYDYFSASVYHGLNNGTPTSGSYAFGGQYDYNLGAYNFYGNTNSLQFTPDPTLAVPTPALLPGAIGMGIAAFRKRKKESAIG